MVPIFDTAVRDSQETVIEPVSPQKFRLEEYAEYEQALQERCRKFFGIRTVTNETPQSCGFAKAAHQMESRDESRGGLLVYRRVRGNGVFYDRCRDYRESLACQLGALTESMKYKADVPNFLEPWHGIGYIAGAFGGDYIWKEGQAPAVKPVFANVEELLSAEPAALNTTPAGRRILEMEEYFLDQTKGKIPMSFCDVQSPLNMLSCLIPINQLFLDLCDDPDRVKQAALVVADLLTAFLKCQQELIGDALALPGHGFASARAFCGIGMSDDNAVMLSPADYTECFMPADERIGERFGGVGFHSCGCYERQIPMVRQIKGLTQADGAFTVRTDPMPNRPQVFAEAFAGSGIVLNVRAVGSAEETVPVFETLIQPGIRLIAVTYCGVKEQVELYERLHRTAAERGI